MVGISTVSFAFVALAGLAQSQPLTARAGRISCSTDGTHGTLKYHQSAYHGSVNPVTIHTSAGGQQQLAIADGAPIEVIGRKCTSSHLGEDANVSKVFVANDESKCVVRHGALHSQTARTHITIEDCSDVDDSRQARQSWRASDDFASLKPYYKKGDSQSIYLLSQKVGDDYILFSDLSSYNGNILKIVQ